MKKIISFILMLLISGMLGQVFASGLNYSETLEPECVEDGRFGKVVEMGDLNGDGFDDVIVSNDPLHYSITGYTNIYLGSATGRLTYGGKITLSAESLATADVNHDGYDDLIVGHTTSVGVFYGKRGQGYNLFGDRDWDDADWGRGGEAYLDNFGTSVASAGDLNGDGIEDFAVGAPNHWDQGDDGTYGCEVGAVYFFYGSASGPTVPPQDSRSYIPGSQCSAGFGSVVARGGYDDRGFSTVAVGIRSLDVDINRDSFISDQEENLGAVKILHPFQEYSPGSIIYGDNLRNVHFGSALASAGDINGDGYPDIIVGTRGWYAPLNKAFSFNGIPSGSISHTYNWSFQATNSVNMNRPSFFAVGGAGDINRDGFDDVIIGEPLYDAIPTYLNRDNSPLGYWGRIYVWFGSKSGLGQGNVTLGNITISQPFTIDAEGVDGEFGYSVASGDINGDGYSDIVVGVPKGIAVGCGIETGLVKVYLSGFAPPDRDFDGVPDERDNCPRISNDDQSDRDDDGRGDACDNCVDLGNRDQADVDGDGIGDACDVCNRDPNNDVDGDSVCGDIDNCPLVANNNQTDSDADGVGDVCDNCPLVSNQDQIDTDGDAVGDTCDNCRDVPNTNQANNGDADIWGDVCDNCPNTENNNQGDADGDGQGDACDLDADNDGITNATDNCPYASNPDQTESPEVEIFLSDHFDANAYHGKPASWEVGGECTYSYISIVGAAETGVGGRSLALQASHQYCSPRSSAWARKNFAQQKEVLWKFEFQTYSTLGSVFELKGDSGSTTAVKLIAGWFHPETNESGWLQYHDGSAWVPIQRIQSDIFYQIKVRADSDTDTFDLYLNGLLMGSGLPFASPVNQGLDQVLYEAYDNNYRTYVDNVEVYLEANDGIGDACDNCVNVYNPDQTNTFYPYVGPYSGDACEGLGFEDTDGDGDPDRTDCSPKDPFIYHGAKWEGRCSEQVWWDYNCDGLIDTAETCLERYAPVLHMTGGFSTEDDFLPKEIASMLNESDLRGPRHLTGDGWVTLYNGMPVTEDDLFSPGNHNMENKDLDMINADPGIVTATNPVGGSPGECPENTICGYSDFGSYMVPSPSRFNNTYQTTVYGREALYSWSGIGEYMPDKFRVLQYWIFYPYNDYYDKHEGDWEMVQIILDNATKNPMKITYSWHNGGTTFDWDDPSILKIDSTHPAVFVASGSHASYWSSTPFTFWQNIGPGGIADGIGCSGWVDYMSPVLKTLVPEGINYIGDPYALIPISEQTTWTEWKGRWGEVELIATDGDRGPRSPQFSSVESPAGIISKWHSPTRYANNPMSENYISCGMSPIEVHVYDEKGNHVGRTPAGILEKKIPGLYMYNTDNKQMLIVTSQDLTYKIEATDAGMFDFQFRRYRREASTTTAVFYNKVKITENTVATVQVAPSNPDYLMKIDLDGDGNVDLTRTPDDIVVKSFPVGNLPENVSPEPFSSEEDGDSDGVLNLIDNCPEVNNPAQTDLDKDGIGDDCDDSDSDGINDSSDNCVLIPNSDQSDADDDNIGDKCDNCPADSNPEQSDIDADGSGDVCDDDTDGDGYSNDDEIASGSDPDNPYSEPGASMLTLHAGYNLISFPAETMYYENIYKFMEAVGGAAVISHLYIFDPFEQTYNEAGYDAGGQPYGDKGELLSGQGLEGLIVYAKQDETFKFTSKYCYTWDLKAGINLVGTPCARMDMSAFELLEDIGGADKVYSIQRFDHSSGRFISAGYFNGDLIGVDFPIKAGEGYFIHMKQDVTGFRP